MKNTPFPQSLEELYNHPNFHPFPSSSDEWINDPERTERCEEAAEHGADGSFHFEIISDWREFLERLESDERRRLENQDKDEQEIESDLAAFEALVESITEEIDACEAWHEANGSLYSQVG